MEALFYLRALPSWEVVSLLAPVTDSMFWGKPVVGQLMWLLGEHRQYGIVAIDHKGARFFRSSLGEIVEQKETTFAIDTSDWKEKDLGHFTGEAVTKTYGTQRDVFEKRLENQYARLCAAAAKQALTLFSAAEVAAVFLAGPDKLIATLESKFPRPLGQQIVRVDEDVARMTPTDILSHLKSPMRAWELQHQATLVNKIAQSERATIQGFDETLAELQKGKIRTLLLARELNPELHECAVCGWMDRSADPVCPVCGGRRRSTTLIKSIPDLLLKYHVELQIISGDTANRLNQMGGMAGWSRQPQRAKARAGS